MGLASRSWGKMPERRESPPGDSGAPDEIAPSPPAGGDAMDDDLARAIRGDADAFGRLVERHQEDVVTTAAYWLGNRDDALDCAQEAFLRAFRSVGSFRRGASFKTWILTITVNAARSLRTRARAKKRGGGRTVRLETMGGDDGPGIEPEADPRGGPEGLLRRREVKEAIERALASLDPEAREVIVLRDVAGENYEDIAREVGLPIGTVKSRIHRARLALQAKLARWL
jgi:RNA polymerase sigma-70 factor (ECF subfamily)